MLGAPAPFDETCWAAENSIDMRNDEESWSGSSLDSSQTSVIVVGASEFTSSFTGQIVQPVKPGALN